MKVATLVLDSPRPDSDVTYRGGYKTNTQMNDTGFAFPLQRLSNRENRKTPLPSAVTSMYSSVLLKGMTRLWSMNRFSRYISHWGTRQHNLNRLAVRLSNYRTAVVLLSRWTPPQPPSGCSGEGDHI